MSSPPSITVVIPTYQREDVLLRTIEFILALSHQPDALFVIDQTVQHLPDTDAQLDLWQTLGKISWVRLAKPSIPSAMNTGLRQATTDLVFFLDDDIEPRSEIIACHCQQFHADKSLWATVGQVIQPWQKPEDLIAPRTLSGLRTDFDFPFHSTIDGDVENVMAGNLCVHRERALAIGGFDENFQGSAYRFETEFARRIVNAGGRIKYLGSAGIDHLRVTSGGTRKDGSHLTSASPQHGIGDHYYAFLHGGRAEAWKYSIGRVFREIRTRFHLTHPWWIPAKLLGEIRAMMAGYAMAKRKRREEQRVGINK